MGTALVVCLSLLCLFKLLEQELFINLVQGVGDELGLEPVGHCLKTHVHLEHAPCSVECGAMMLGTHRVDLQ